MSYIINKKINGCNYWLNLSFKSTGGDSGYGQIQWEGLRNNAFGYSNINNALVHLEEVRKYEPKNTKLEIQNEDGTKINFTN